MKKYISILFLIVLFGPIAIAFSWLQMQKQMIRKEVKHSIIVENKHLLVSLSFDEKTINNQINWVKAEKEFEYLGEMYDVVEKKSSNGKIHFVCWHDNEETALNKKLDDLYSIVLSKHPKRQQSLFQINLFTKNLFHQYNRVKLPSFILKDIKHSTHNIYLINDLTYSPPCPPPEFC